MSEQIFEDEIDESMLTADEEDAIGDLDQYFLEINAYSKLTKEEELELAKRCAAGDEEAMSLLINSNLRLVVSIAKKFDNDNLHLLDLIQEGSVGLVEAAKEFDYSKDCRLSTYAYQRILKYVREYKLTQMSNVGGSRDAFEMEKELPTIIERFYQENGRKPTVEELALECGLRVTRMKELLEFSSKTSSLDAPISDEDDSTMQELLEDDTAKKPAEELVRRELKESIKKLLDTVTDRQREVLRLHFGMEDGTCYNLSEIARELGISRQRAREIEQEALGKLQQNSAGLGLEDFLQ